MIMCCRVVAVLVVQFTVQFLCLKLLLPRTLVLKIFLLHVIMTGRQNMSAK